MVAGEHCLPLINFGPLNSLKVSHGLESGSEYYAVTSPGV